MAGDTVPRKLKETLNAAYGRLATWLTFCTSFRLFGVDESYLKYGLGAVTDPVKAAERVVDLLQSILSARSDSHILVGPMSRHRGCQGHIC